MRHEEFTGINSFLVGMARILLKDSVERNTRNFKCYELPTPIIIKITNPQSRIITVQERNWNHILPYVESLWLASGRNDMSMVGHYVKKLFDFSDDNKTMRAGYGPRLRFFNGVSNDYNTGYHQQSENHNDKKITEVDQFRFIEQAFKSDPYTRQGMISLADPAKDCFDENQYLKRTKDFPCTRDLQFIRNKDKLDLIVHMRSNDFIWGATGVNIFNFSFMQEYFAQILGLEVGSYYHIVNNFHYYENFQEKVQELADISAVSDESYTYEKKFKNLNEFDERVVALETYEKQLRENNAKEIMDFDDDFFNDWAKVLFSFHHNKSKIKFSNPMLDLVSKRKLNLKNIKENKTQFEKTLVSDDDYSTTYWQNSI